MYSQSSGATWANKVIRNSGTLRPKLPHSAVEIDSVPVHDSRGDHTEARGGEALVLKRAVADLALAMGEHRAAQRIAGFALVQPPHSCAGASRGLTAIGTFRYFWPKRKTDP